jgi:hypothetical protein
MELRSEFERAASLTHNERERDLLHHGAAECGRNKIGESMVERRMVK